jgi:hypothetical protein
MSAFEYQVVPAPRRGKSGRGIKGGPAKFANAITDLMNEMGAQGWEYLRADTLPCEERQGLTSKTVKYHSMLVFRRATDPSGVDATMLALEHHEDRLEDYADLEEPEAQTDEVSELDQDPAQEPADEDQARA